ncbi:hypothetical protein A3SO_07175 [Pseudomonas syringae pv. actinidiae ICMP 19072]|nr:hypothetical protein A3SO_07175 [Pseudomonas syringae pv. actinidiae ICMP 19072]
MAAADMPTAYDFSTLDKDYCIPHPTSGELSFGYISMYESRNLTLPGGEIYLRVGKHFGFSSGFGVNHIWQGHGHQLAKSGCKTIQDASAFVAGILSAGPRFIARVIRRVMDIDSQSYAMPKGAQFCRHKKKLNEDVSTQWSLPTKYSGGDRRSE